VWAPQVVGDSRPSLGLLLIGPRYLSQGEEEEKGMGGVNLVAGSSVRRQPGGAATA
jgi:hypothetical protein